MSFYAPNVYSMSIYCDRSLCKSNVYLLWQFFYVQSVSVYYDNYFMYIQCQFTVTVFFVYIQCLFTETVILYSFSVNLLRRFFMLIKCIFT